MNLTDQVALVTGSNRGIGRHLVDELRTRGVRKVYATARRPVQIDDPRVEPLHLDLTDRASVEAAARRATDVTLVINNAGTYSGTPLVTGDLDEVRRELDSHLWGTLQVIRSFAPVLAVNGGGAISNILSAAAWFAAPGNGAYGVAKSAEWAMTNAVRLELAAQRTLVQGVHLGATDTDFAAHYDGPKTDPREVARATLDGLAAGAIEVVVDDASATVKASLAKDPFSFYEALLAPNETETRA